MNCDTDPEENRVDSCLVHVPENRFEADIIIQALEREGIPVLCHLHEETAYDGLFIPQRGWAGLLVPSCYRDKALEIISEILNSYAPTNPPKATFP